MPYESLCCPECGAAVRSYRNPFPTVDIIIRTGDGIVLIERKNPPYGWALPGGFVDYGESLEDAARREALEETGAVIEGLMLVGCYSSPDRDSRMHTISTVFAATAGNVLKAGDDAANLKVFRLDDLPSPLCFDHARIIADYMMRKS